MQVSYILNKTDLDLLFPNPPLKVIQNEIIV